jgi:uracil-DNA glycosylase family 4
MTLTGNPKCTRCALHKTCESVCVMGDGPKRSDVMFIGEAPGRTEDSEGIPFVGRSGELLDTTLDLVGIERDEVYVTNVVKCRPPDNRTPKAAEIKACNKYLEYEIAVVKPNIIVLMGNTPLKTVLGLKGIKKYRGKPIERDGIVYLPMFHPSFVLRSQRTGRPVDGLFQQDMRTLKEMIEFGGIPEERNLNSIVVDTWDKVDEMIDALRDVVSADLETTCLYPWQEARKENDFVEAKVVTMGFGTATGEYHVFLNHRDSKWSRSDQLKIIQRVTKRLCEKCTVVFQNGKFDALWMLVKYGVRWPIDFDTMLAHYLHDENDLHDLEHLAKLYFGASRWDIPLEEKQGKAPIPKIAKYHAHDLYYTRQLYFKLKQLLRQDALVYRVFSKIMMPCANLFVDVEFNGCYVDLSKMGEAEKFLRNEAKTAETALKKWGNINWASPRQVGELLYGKLKIKCPMKTKKGANSTAESALKQIDHDCVGDLLKMRGAKQQLSFFIDGWKPYIYNRRIHPSFKLHGTVTGRLSCEHPNFQQVPRDVRIRSLITAPEGWTFLEADLSQIELRIVAELAQEPSMMEAFQNEIDIHWLTAMREIERGAGLKDLIIDTAKTAKQLKKCTYSEAIEILLDVGPDVAAEIDREWKEYRKKAKAINFGYVFGMWWKKFKIYARDNYDVHLTDEQAQQSRKAFFQMYALEDWHKKQKRYAATAGYVRSLSGRKRRLPKATLAEDTPERAEAQRQAINSPVQSFANEINLMTLIQLSDEFGPDVFRPVMTVHDSIGAEVRDDMVETITKRCNEIQERPKLFDDFEIELSVPICGEVKLGPWGLGVSLPKWKKQRQKEAA